MTLRHLLFAINFFFCAFKRILEKLAKCFYLKSYLRPEDRIHMKNGIFPVTFASMGFLPLFQRMSLSGKLYRTIFLIILRFRDPDDNSYLKLDLTILHIDLIFSLYYRINVYLVTKCTNVHI